MLILNCPCAMSTPRHSHTYTPTRTTMATPSTSATTINGAVKTVTSKAYLEGSKVKETKALITGLCRQFYHLGWVSGTGGSIAIKVRDGSVPKAEQLIVMSPSGVPNGRQDIKVSAKAGTFSLNDGNGKSRQCIVLDIEGTTTPISFVTDVLFPYARDSVGKHLELTYDTPETQDDIKLLYEQVNKDLQNGVAGAVPIPSDGGKEEVIAAVITNVRAMIKADRKITALKQLQGHIWQTGFQNRELEGVVFEDVPKALERWHSLGIKVYIYSSGSRLAQRLLFGNTNYGDLRKYLCGFFDTTTGNKKETKSYVQISETLGVDDPSKILFLTDVYEEATAAKAAGLEAIISVRPGNGGLPENHGFQTIKSFSEI